MGSFVIYNYINRYLLKYIYLQKAFSEQLHGIRGSSRDGEVGQSGSLAFWNEGRNQWMNDAGKAPSGEMNFYASRSTPVVGEVRPVNRAVCYLIRAR